MSWNNGFERRKFEGKWGKEVAKKRPKRIPVIINVQDTSILKGRTAVITGGSSGIGYAIAKAYLKAGSKVVITGRDVVKLEKLKTELNYDYPDKIYSFKLDNGQISNFIGVFDTIESIIFKYSETAIRIGKGLGNEKIFVHAISVRNGASSVAFRTGGVKGKNEQLRCP